ncbi:hypothetical protein J4205_03685 [Candidatus Pacearchaeota archaeon]|nr:hypothetical protein [Candidatus Pacearchaeota archaeon]
MIASIDNQADICLYLEAEELKKLENETIEGVLIKILKPKRQGAISISVNDKRKYENGLGIGIDDSRYWDVKDNFHLGIFMGTEFYQELSKKGVIGLRQRMRDGSKIHIYDRSKLNGIDEIYVETFEFYRDNKDKLRKDLG